MFIYFYFTFILLCVLFLILLQFIPCYKLGIPLYWNNVIYTLFIFVNKSKFKIIDNSHLQYKDKIIVFYEPWLFEVYEGFSKEEIRIKCDLGGQSNKASYLTWWEKLIGKNIENWYLQNIENRFRK